MAVGTCAVLARRAAWVAGALALALVVGWVSSVSAICYYGCHDLHYAHDPSLKGTQYPYVEYRGALNAHWTQSLRVPDGPEARSTGSKVT